MKHKYQWWPKQQKFETRETASTTGIKYEQMIIIKMIMMTVLMIMTNDNDNDMENISQYSEQRSSISELCYPQ